MTKPENFDKVIRALGLLAADIELLQQKRAIREERALRAVYEKQEYQLTIDTGFSQKLFIALAKEDGVTPYREGKQRKTTLMVKMTEPAMKNLWARFHALNSLLIEELHRVTNEFVADAIEVDRQAQAEGPSPDSQTAFEGFEV